MKFHKFLLTTLILVLITSVAVSSAAPENRPRDPPRGERPAGFAVNGFNSSTSNLEVTGDLFIDDGIVLTINVQSTRIVTRPNGDVIEPVRENEMTIILTQLVEFEDTTANGYSDDDVVVSTYLLNEDSLNDIEYGVEGDMIIYRVTSIDGVFEMVIELNQTNDLPHDWKWSVTIDYPYESTTSSIAMIHEYYMGRTYVPMHEQIQRGNMTGNTYTYQNRTMVNNASGIPLRFAWDDFAIVDGVEENVTATNVNDIFALSVVQGDIIDYDPNLGIDINDLTELDDYFATEFGSFFESLPTPTITTIAITFGVIAAISIVNILIKKRK